MVSSHNIPLKLTWNSPSESSSGVQSESTCELKDTATVVNLSFGANSGENSDLFLAIGKEACFVYLQKLSICNSSGKEIFSWSKNPEALYSDHPRQCLLLKAIDGAILMLQGPSFGLDLSSLHLNWDELRDGGSIVIALARAVSIEAPLEKCSSLENILENQQRIGRLNQLLRKQSIVIANRGKLIEEWKHNVRAMRGSNSWILTAPLRSLTKNFRKYTAKLSTGAPVKNANLVALNRWVSTTVDVVIPVYENAATTIRCLQSVIATQSSGAFEIIVVDDCSPNAEIKSFLDKLSERKQIKLIRSEKNLGFSGACNLGMAAHLDRDVVLLNSDTAVSNDWLARLQMAAYSRHTIGTVTPFSNVATICSYPVVNERNELPYGWTASQLDNLIRETNPGVTIDLPTAVGFCMYIKRQCLEETGTFNEKEFPQGYGEENEFCWRAKKLGWQHVLAADTFVYHEGSASFGASRKEKERRALTQLRQLCPGYEADVDKHIKKNPAKNFREAIDIERLKATSRPILLYVTHELTGGVPRHIEELAEAISENAVVLQLRPSKKKWLELTWASKGEGLKLHFENDSINSIEKLVSFLKSLPVARIHIHHTMGFGPELQQLLQLLALPIDFTLHDFYTVCPRIKLANGAAGYCGQPDTDGCNRCLATGTKVPKATDIEKWRKEHNWLLSETDRIIVPSYDTAEKFKQYYPQAKFHVGEHIANFSCNVSVKPRLLENKDDRLLVAVVGALGPEKGSRLLDAAGIDAFERKLPTDFLLIGCSDIDLNTDVQSNVTVYGAYKEEVLPTLLAHIRPHLVWFTAQWPETFSYTLSTVLAAGLPIIVPNIGAFSERTRGRQWTWSVDWQSPAEKINDLIAGPVRSAFISGQAPDTGENPPVVYDFDYQRDYLSPLSNPKKAFKVQV